MSYRFEQLETWQLARKFVNEIYTLANAFPKEETFGLTIQVKRASLSILLNITEGSDRKSDVEFIRFLRIAYTSMEEVVAGLYIAMDQDYIDKTSFEIVYDKSNELGKKINSLIKYLKKTIKLSLQQRRLLGSN